MDVRLKRAKELAGYAVRLTKDEGLPTMVKRGAGFVRRRFFGKRARYLPGRKVLEAQRAEMAGKTAEDCGLPTISILTPLYNTPENYLREFLDSFVGQTAPNGQLCLADASDDAHPEVERIVREYQQKNQRIGYKKVENKGIAANTNAAEVLADGEYLALADHDAGQKRELLQNLLRMIGYLRTAQPDGQLGTHLMQLGNDLLHHFPIPDITGKRHCLRLSLIKIGEDFLHRLIDRILGKLHLCRCLRMVFFRIGPQTVKRRIGMNIFCVQCRQ